ncbi:MAG TPA: hypothetical protein VGY98_15665 [Verrucomicrobiae bacterium]|nr:hypothetical protein [Verrucomicrobiae bacterium]
MTASVFSEPFTPRGIAAFARAGVRRLLVAQFIFAFFAASAVAYFFHRACFPVIETAIDNLPDSGQVQSGSLAWSGDPQTLADGPFLAINVDPDHAGQWHSTTADFQIELGRDTVRVFSLFGYADVSYPVRDAPFNQPDLDPLWKAWRAEILFLIAAITMVLLPATWWILAAVYFLPAKLLGFFANRDLSLLASLKLCCAALLPGALFMTAALILYALDLLGLVAFCFVLAAHFILHWLYLLFALPFLPRLSNAPGKGNPFKLGKT